MTPAAARAEGARTLAAEWGWILLGGLGLAIVAAGALLDSHGLLEAGASWRRLAFTLPGHGVALWAWWRLGPSARLQRPALVLWCAVLTFAPPLHSRDAFSYAAQGWLMAHGLNPYAVPSGDAGMPGLLVGVHWFRTTSVYPPAALELFGAISRLFDADLWWAVIGMRLPNLIAIAVLAGVLPRLARRAGVDGRVALWAGLANPLIVVQWVGGIHNDAVMVAVLALAFLAAGDGAWRGYRGMLAGGVLIGVAMGVKQSAAVAGLAVVALAWQATLPGLDAARRTWWALLRRSLAAGAAALLVFVAWSLGSGLGFGWRNDTAGSPLSATSNAPISWVASFARFHELATPETIIAVLTTLSTALVAAALVWLVLRYGPRPPDGPGRPWVLVVGSLLAFAVLGPALQPWYLTWAVPFVALARPTRASQHLWLVGLCCAAVIPAFQDLTAPYVAMFVLALPAGWLWMWLRRRDVPVLGHDQTTV